MPQNHATDPTEYEIQIGHIAKNRHASCNMYKSSWLNWLNKVGEEQKTELNV